MEIRVAYNEFAARRIGNHSNKCGEGNTMTHNAMTVERLWDLSWVAATIPSWGYAPSTIQNEDILSTALMVQE